MPAIATTRTGYVGTVTVPDGFHGHESTLHICHDAAGDVYAIHAHGFYTIPDAMRFTARLVNAPLDEVQARKGPLLDLVAVKNDWRAPVATLLVSIRKYYTVDALDKLAERDDAFADATVFDIMEAIVFYTATRPNLVRTTLHGDSLTFWRFDAVGYRYGPAGDH